MILFIIAVIVFIAVLELANWFKAIDEALKEMEQPEKPEITFVDETEDLEQQANFEAELNFDIMDEEQNQNET